MTERNIVLTIKGQIIDSPNDNESVELNTEGIAFKEDDQDGLSYDETELYGMQGTRTTILISKNTVTIVRLGTVNSELEFSPDKRNVTLYATPYGEIQIGILTNSLSVKYTKDHWVKKILIDYSIEIGGNAPLHNTIDINVHY